MEEKEESSFDEISEIVLFVQMDGRRVGEDLWNTASRWNYGLQQEFNSHHHLWTHPQLPRVSAQALADFRYSMITPTAKSTYLLFSHNATTDYKSVVDYMIARLPENKTVIRDILYSREYMDEQSVHEGGPPSFLLPPSNTAQQGCLILTATSPQLTQVTTILLKLTIPLTGILPTPIRFFFCAIGPETHKDECVMLGHACAAVMCDSRFVANIYDLDANGFRQNLQRDLSRVVLAPNLKLTAWFKENLYEDNDGQADLFGAEIPQHLFIQQDTFSVNHGWTHAVRHWNFGLTQSRTVGPLHGTQGQWSRPALPTLDVWAVAQLRVALRPLHVIFDVSPTTYNTALHNSDPMKKVVKQALDRLLSIDHITVDDYKIAQAVFSRYKHNTPPPGTTTATVQSSAPPSPSTHPEAVPDSVLAPSRTQEAVVCLTGVAFRLKYPIVCFVRLTSTIQYSNIVEGNAPVRFVLLLLLPADKNENVTSSRSKLSAKLGKSFCDVFCSEELMTSARECTSGNEFINALDKRLGELSVVRVTSMVDHEVLKNPGNVRAGERLGESTRGESLFNSAAFTATEEKHPNLQRGQSFSSYNSQDSEKPTAFENSAMDFDEAEIERLFVTKVTRDLKKKTRRKSVRWDIRQRPTLSSGWSLRTLNQFLIKTSIPLLLGCIIGIILASVYPDYDYLFNPSTKSPFYCLFENVQENACFEILGQPLTVSLLVNDGLVSFFFALVISQIREMLFDDPVRLKTAAIGAVGGIIGPLLLYLPLSLTLDPTTTPTSTLTATQHSWPIVLGSFVPLVWYLSISAFGKRHPAVKIALLVAILTEAFQVLVMCFVVVKNGELYGLGFLAGGISLSCIFRWVLHMNWWSPYFIFCGGLNWIGLTILGLYPALCLVPVVLLLPKEILLYNGLPYVAFQYLTGQLHKIEVQDRNPRGSHFFPQMRRRSTMTRGAVSTLNRSSQVDSSLNNTSDSFLLTSHATSYNSLRSLLPCTTTPQASQPYNTIHFMGSLQRFEADLEYLIHYSLFIVGLVNCGFSFTDALQDDFSANYILIVAASKLAGKVLGLGFVLEAARWRDWAVVPMSRIEVVVVGVILSISLPFPLLFISLTVPTEFTYPARFAVVVQGVIAALLTYLYRFYVVVGRRRDIRASKRMALEELKVMEEVGKASLEQGGNFEAFESILIEDEKQDLADVIAMFLEKRLQRRQVKSRRVEKLSIRQMRKSQRKSQRKSRRKSAKPLQRVTNPTPM